MIPEPINLFTLHFIFVIFLNFISQFPMGIPIGDQHTKYEISKSRRFARGTLTANGISVIVRTEGLKRVLGR